MPGIPKLARFVAQFETLLTLPSEDQLMEAGEQTLRSLIATDDWLPDEFAVPGADHYRQYLLYCDPAQRFCVVSFVWGPGQATPIHNHGVWGLVGVLRGAESSQRFEPGPGGIRAVGAPDVLRAGDVERLSPARGDIHQVRSHDPRLTSVSIHVYGCDIGRQERLAFDEGGGRRRFVSGYSNDRAPNLWGPGFVPVATGAGGPGP